MRCRSVEGSRVKKGEVQISVVQCSVVHQKRVVKLNKAEVQ